MYQALYRKYRPKTFDDVVGQQAVTVTLKNQIQTGRMSHAYLFTGSRGTGKTSCARILAKAVNCENPQQGNPCNCCPSCRAIDEGTCMDVLEIDAASNNGVDSVRDLRDDAVYTPAQVKKRVYIIDEVHMLTTSAFNALLKIIEEPPEHLLFVLATTELHKVPATILSRCQRFAFRRIGQEDIAARLQYVAYQEGIDLDDGAARLMARMADGGMRDGMSLLDQCASATEGELNRERVYACLGIAGEQSCAEMMSMIGRKDTAGVLNLFGRLYAEGKDVAAMLDELCCVARDLLVMKTAPEGGQAMLSGVCDEQDVLELCRVFSTGELTRIMEMLRATAAGFTKSGSRRMDAELCLISLCRPELSVDAQALNARLTSLEERIAAGQIPAPVEQKHNLTENENVKKESVATTPQPAKEPENLVSEAPRGFETDLFSALKKEGSGADFGWFVPGSVSTLLQEGTLYLRCKNSFVLEQVNKPELLSRVATKASAMLKQQVRVVAVGVEEEISRNRMRSLVEFGKDNPDIIRVKS